MVNDDAGPPGYQAVSRDDLCLSFANTRCWRGIAEPTETLRGPDDLLGWAAGEGGVDPALVGACRILWSSPAAGGQALDVALGIRETIYGLFEHPAPPAERIEALNRLLVAAPVRTRLAVGPNGMGWRYQASASVLSLLAPVIWSAADLLTSSRLARVRICANPKCRWVFLDDSKAATRRWCSMSACGNRAKAHRHYLRRKGG